MSKSLKYFSACLAVIVAALISVVATPVIAYAAEQASAIVPVAQTVEIEDEADLIDIEYTLSSLSPDYPLPSDAVDGKLVGTMKGNVSDTIELLFDEPGVYDYQMKCTQEAVENWTLDPAVYDIRVHVSNDLTAIVLIFDADNNKVADASWKASYKKPATPVVEEPVINTFKPVEQPVEVEEVPEAPVVEQPAKPVEQPSQPTRIVSTGDVAMIVIGSVIALAILGGGIAYLVRRKRDE